jgi:sugar lactone lactonase YvrE
MRWLWKDWPQPIKNSGTKNATLAALLIPGEEWKLVSQGHRFTEGPSTNAKGEVFFNDVPGGKTFKVSLDGTVSEFIKDTKRADGQAFGPDGALYSAVPSIDSIVKRDASGQETAVAEGFKGNDVVVGSNGNIYVTNPGVGAPDQSRIWLIKPNGEKKIVDTGLLFANGITMSPDQTLLYVDDMRSHWVYCYQIAADGTLRAKQRFDYLHVPDTADDSGADGMRVDSEGRLYVATRMGVQIADQAGKVQCIIPTPNRVISNMTFGGENFDVLYVTAGDRVFKRKLKVKGAFAWMPPLKPAAPRL